MSAHDDALRELVSAILSDDAGSWRAQLVSLPELARIAFVSGATRQAEEGYFLDSIQRWIYAGDTALHIAAAAYRLHAVEALIGAGADVLAHNRHGQTPLHSAAAGDPGCPSWNPHAQAATITVLLEAGADPNAPDKRRVTPLHVAVRTRCAEAVRILLEHGADPALPNGSGSTALLLASLCTGRSGSGSTGARAEQQRILALLEHALLQPR